VPRQFQAELKRLVQQVFHADSYEEGLRRGRALIARFKDRYAAAMECLEKDQEACLLYLKFPPEPQKRIRTTNALEQIIEEVKRRTKVVGRLPSESAALKLVYAGGQHLRPPVAGDRRDGGAVGPDRSGSASRERVQAERRMGDPGIRKLTTEASMLYTFYSNART